MQCSSQDIQAVLKRYDKILLTAHVSPDGDAVGSLLGLAEWLQAEEKQVAIVVDDDIDERFAFLPLAKMICRPDAVETDDSWLSVILDVTDMGRIGRVAELVKGKILNIDHHVSNSHFADWEYVYPDSAATGELLTSLFLEWQADITPDMANALYMAIATDCGFFRFGNTTGHTLRMAAALRDAGAEPNRISDRLETRSFASLQVLSDVLKQIEVFRNVPVASLAFTPELLRRTGEHTGSYIDYVRMIQHVDVAFTVKYIGPAETRVSLRSKTVDVNAVAAVFGGGGHIRAAGCTIKAPLEEAKKMILKEIIHVYDTRNC